jgi:hypothetical protein
MVLGDQLFDSSGNSHEYQRCFARLIRQGLDCVGKLAGCLHILEAVKFIDNRDKQTIFRKRQGCRKNFVGSDFLRKALVAPCYDGALDSN